MGKGIRRLRVRDQLPACEIALNTIAIYDLTELARGKRVLDIGCGYGGHRQTVESVGGTWIGIEPFPNGAATVGADAEALPFPCASFDVVISDAVFEHIPDVAQAFREVARVLKPSGVLVGYVAFMECFHEISYSHLSFKALEHFATINGMRLERLAGGTRFGIDYHLAVHLYPLPFVTGRRLIAASIRGLVWLKSRATIPMLRIRRGLSRADARTLADDYYALECLRQSNGFTFVIRRDH